MPTLTRFTILVITALSMNVIFGEEVYIEISHYNDGNLEIFMENSSDVGGFQFNVESSFGDFTVHGASGGRAGDAGFMMSSSPSGMVLGFSMTGAVITSGSGALCFVDVGFTGSEGNFSLSSPVFSNASGQAMSVELGTDFEIGGPELCEDIDACNYGAEGDCEYIADGACDCEGHVEDCAGECGGNLELDECGVCGGDGSECVETYFDVNLPNTGESSLIVFESAIANLDEGDEIGLFDASGITEGNDACDGSFDGEVLVGAGTWTGSQLELTAVGSVDMCQFGGSQLAGYVDGNNIVAKVWKASEEMEYDVTLDYSMGNGTFGSILTSVSGVTFAEAHFNVDLPITGESSLIVFESTISTLEVGDEIGLFDASGITEANDACDGSFNGEVLVGAGTWSGTQLELVAVGSVDMCDFGGGQLAGYVSGNSIIAKVWDASEEVETEVNLSYSTGNGNYGSILTAVSEISVGASYEIVINEFFFRSAAGTSVPDYVELYNASSDEVDISGWMINDEDGIISSGTIPAWGYFLLSKDDPFFNADADELYAGEDIENSAIVDFNLSTNSGTIILLDANSNEVDNLHYSIGEGWPVGSANRGHSVELLDWTSDNSDPSNWYSSNGISDILWGEDGSDEELANFGTPNAENEESGGTDDVIGCMDESSCNFNSEANVDCGDCCEYPEENFDCEGNCVVDVDCNGDCGGEAVLDECGICNGEGIPAGECDCDGNVEDCLGVCGGDAVVDECGVCDGEGIPDGACDCAGNVEDCAGVCGGIAENCPEWQYDAGAWEFTAWITAEVYYDDALLNDSGDQLAAFDASGNVRGVAVEVVPDFGPNAGSTLFEITMGSNANGDAISFKYYDASDDVVYDLTSTYSFTANESSGDWFEPYGLYGYSTVDISIDLSAGWNWISFNVDPDDNSLNTLLASVSESASFIASQSSGIANNYGVYGWGGSLSSLDATNMYKLYMDEAATLTITGMPVDVATTPIALASGWNWIGYLPQNAGDLNTALASVSESASFIASQSSGIANNYGAYGWGGSLSTMEPGSGYLLNMTTPDELVYPSFDGMARLSSNKEAVVLNSTITDWDFNYSDYQYIGTITASIESREDVSGDVVGVFVDGECRGVAERTAFPFEDDSYYYIIQVYSNDLDGEELQFKYYDSTEDVVVDYTESITFDNNMVVGDGFNTYGLSCEARSLELDTYELSEAYPNPFNPVTSFEYTMPEDGMVEIAVYDISGRMVAELASGYMAAGTYPLTWDANDLSSGVYLLQMIAGDFVTMQKVMLIK